MQPDKTNGLEWLVTTVASLCRGAWALCLLAYSDRRARRQIGTVLAIAVALGIVLFFAGCGPSERNTGTEQGSAPISPLTRAEAWQAAQASAAAIGPHAYVLGISDTGSMEPLINSYSYVVLVPSDGSDLHPGEVVLYYHSAEHPRTLHKASSAINATHFIPDGIANSRYDGWQPRANIRAKLVSTVYFGGRQ